MPNILLILMESMRAHEIGVLGSKLGLTPQFDQWSKKGILYTNFFANGYQTRHGILASYCSVFPNYGLPVLPNYEHNHFFCLPHALNLEGYQTLWGFGSDAGFDNQIHVIPHFGFGSMFDELAFPSGSKRLGWGYSDHDLFQVWLERLNSLQKPFFSSVLTITNHHPYDVPKQYQKFPEDSIHHKYYNALSYSDDALGHFLAQASKQEWYDNTLIFITADSSSYQKADFAPKTEIDNIRLLSRIPLLIVGGKITEAHVVDDFHSQVDLAPTILDLISRSRSVPWVGKSMLFRPREEASLAYTNRPGNYWAIMSQSGAFFRSSGRDHSVGLDEKTKSYYQALGRSWIQVTKWLLQEDRIWPQE